jgi:hypothetical protein
MTGRSGRVSWAMQDPRGSAAPMRKLSTSLDSKNAKLYHSSPRPDIRLCGDGHLAAI